MGKKSGAKKIRREMEKRFENLVEVREPSKEAAQKFLDGFPEDGWIETDEGFEHESGNWGVFGFPQTKKPGH